MATAMTYAPDFAPLEVTRRRSNTEGQTIYHVHYKGQHVGSVARWEDDPKVWILRNRHGNDIDNPTAQPYYGDTLHNAVFALFNYWWCNLGGERYGR